MRHVLIPRNVIGTIARDWVNDDSASAGGWLYDYFVDHANQAIGVCFYVDEEIGSEEDRLFSQYVDDERFVFRAHEGCVDICFTGPARTLLSEERATLETVQDFVAGVARFGGHVALVFDVRWPPEK